MLPKPPQKNKTRQEELKTSKKQTYSTRSGPESLMGEISDWSTNEIELFMYSSYT